VTNPRWATKDEAAQHIGVSVYTIDRLVKAGVITAHRLGRLVRFDLNEVDLLLQPSIDASQLWGEVAESVNKALSPALAELQARVGQLERVYAEQKEGGQ
jgi:excisionase family DNA binding protein